MNKKKKLNCIFINKNGSSSAKKINEIHEVSQKKIQETIYAPKWKFALEHRWR